MAVTPGERLGPYEVVAAIGVGGMGEVYRATDTRLGREVAVKILPDHLASNAEALERFEAEARTIASLSHPNILSIFEFDRIGDRAIAVTELLEGRTLDDALHERLPWAEVVEIGAAVADALHAAHERGVIHRDVKPQNIFLTSDGRVKVLDFGLASRSIGPSAAAEEKTSPLLSSARPVAGTIGYISPEQIRGEISTPQSDIFSLGCVLFEAFSGASPFLRPTVAETIAALITEPPPELRPKEPLPPALVACVLRCIAKQPEARFRTAALLAANLRASSDEALAPARGRKARRIDSVAVLPFENVRNDPALDYLADGITESLIDHLSHFPRLRVMARSTVFRYAGQAPSPAKAGRELGVRAVLAGTLQQQGEELELQVELVDASDGARLWGSRLRRPASEILPAQEEIVREVGEKLRVRLTGAERRRISRRAREDPEAYKLYLKARHQWNKRTEEGLREAIRYLDEAIAIDPASPRPYAALADCYSILANFGFLRPLDGYPRAKAAASRALELDEEMAEAHAALAFVHDLFDYAPPDAEREFTRAIALRPNYAVARHWYGVFLAGQGRTEAAVEQIGAARELDPLSPIINVEVGLPLLLAREFGAALREFERARQMYPDFAPVHSFIGHAQAQTGELADAIEHYERALQLGAGPETRGWLGHAYARAGRLDEALRCDAELVRSSSSRYVSPAVSGFIRLGGGDRSGALERIAAAAADRALYPQLLADARFDELRDDPAFARIEREVRPGSPARQR